MSVDLSKSMAENVKALGAYEGPKDLTSVIQDIYRVATTLLQGSGGDYCACQMFPCECVEVFMDDLAACVAVRHPEAPQPTNQTEGDA
jgi:hypothetical protein